MMQCRTAWFINHNYSPWAGVTDMLHNLNLPTLEQWQNNVNLIMMYKSIHNLEPCMQVESIPRMGNKNKDVHQF